MAVNPRRPPYPAGDFPPPDFEDEYEIRRAPGWFRPGGERRPLNIGERDLYPAGLGPHDPLRIGGGGGGGYGPGGGGMHPTFDDPLFGGDGGVGGYDSRCDFFFLFSIFSSLIPRSLFPKSRLIRLLAELLLAHVMIPSAPVTFPPIYAVVDDSPVVVDLVEVVLAEVVDSEEEEALEEVILSKGVFFPCRRME